MDIGGLWVVNAQKSSSESKSMTNMSEAAGCGDQRVQGCSLKFWHCFSSSGVRLNSLRCGVAGMTLV